MKRKRRDTMPINPQILVWARSTAGYSVDEAAKALGFKETSKRTATDRLLALEQGQEAPSRSVLLKMAHAYRRSLLVFYLSEPPAIGDRGQDFRKAPGSAPSDFDPTLDALIRDIRGRQSAVKDLLEQIDSRPLDYVASATMEIPPLELARRITERIEFSIKEFRKQATEQDAFRYLREKVEKAGAFVLLLGNLGSYHTNIPSSVFRGYAIADPIAPFIVINDKDAPIARPFTALHELVHLWLGTTGISGNNTDVQVEAYCNNVAGEILLPSAEINELRYLAQATREDAVTAISVFARQRKISRPMVAYKLRLAGILSHATWEKIDGNYKEEWRVAQASEAASTSGNGGPDYYKLKRHRLGHALLDLIRNSLSEGLVTHTKAGFMLGVKPRNVDPLIYAAGTRGGR